MLRLASSRSARAAALLLGLAAAGGGSFLATRAIANQPNMVSALDALRAARADLERAEPNKGGHRERAIGLVDQAIEEVKAGIAFAR